LATFSLTAESFAFIAAFWANGTEASFFLRLAYYLITLSYAFNAAFLSGFLALAIYLFILAALTKSF
jgi:hypothetical protein